ncbi:MAG: Holliday junction branch migration protein RuvA [Patescibacteria group bacterium]|nr:Holliday junction branch migration protein RuvA [Patescibacteria group bacterium]
MISYLKGKIKNQGKDFVVVDVHDIGYKVFISAMFSAKLAVGKEQEFCIYQQVREDALNLYGFASREELELFELLIGISGIGPKSAMGIMSIAAVDDIKESIIRGDSALLTKVSGIGKKTADRVVLELREKIAKLNGGAGKSNQGLSGDEIDALMALGYSLPDAREALSAVDVKIKDSSERIRQALKRLGK